MKITKNLPIRYFGKLMSYVIVNLNVPCDALIQSFGLWLLFVEIRSFIRGILSYIGGKVGLCCS